MLKNYIKTAWRNLLKHKGFSLINIFGLAIGLAAFGLIALYVADELSYDRYHQKADRIFRVVQHGSWSGGTFNLAVTSAPYADVLKNDYPQVEAAVRINNEAGGRISYGDKQIIQGGMLFAENSMFQIFSYHFLYGDSKKALVAPHSIVLTKTLAENIFGDASHALNKTVVIDGGSPNVVTAVIDDVPPNSHFTFTALRSFEGDILKIGSKDYNNWTNASLYTYVLLKDPDDYKTIESHSADFSNKYLKGALSGLKYELQLQPLKSIHLQSSLDYELGANGNLTYVYVFSIVAFLILIIAVINYVNLTTARSSARIKEIGVRKVIGSGRKGLMLMFFSESVLLAFFATCIAAVVINASLPYFNQLSGKNLAFEQIGLLKISMVTIGFSILTGILSGIYPALVLSGFSVIPAMKGQLGNQSGSVIFRQSLVTFQFVITITMIAGSLIIYQQLKYVLNKDLGFNKAQTLTFHINDQSVRTQIAALKQTMLQNPNIESVAIAGNPIGNNDLGLNAFNLDPSGNSGPDTKLVQNLQVDQDFIPTMQIKLAQGRNFSASMPTDKTDGILVNQTLVDEFGWKDPVGKTVRTGIVDGKIIVKTIIGVIRDFNTYSLQHKIAPMVLSMPQQTNDQDNVLEVKQGNTAATLAYISGIYAQFDSQNKLEFHFLDQNFAAQYRVEEKQGSLLMIFTLLAITIASLGLFGLVAFAAQQRTKEIGIRKVLGASISGITLLLSKDLIRLVILALVISVPLAIWAMNSWLQNFAYRVEIHWWIFALAGILALLIAVITVSFQAIKAALANPVKSLRSE